MVTINAAQPNARICRCCGVWFNDLPRSYCPDCREPDNDITLMCASWCDWQGPLCPSCGGIPVVYDSVSALLNCLDCSAWWELAGPAKSDEGGVIPSGN